ncbi:MAG: zinc ribbon domain-containing protein, partial [Gemmatimonadetes bacterium]|nr:zinc ribbon domain-containing protein [Gemmatimonadota bacterium]
MSSPTSNTDGYCTSCGIAVSRYARFCSSCGAPAERTQIADVVVEVSASDALLQALRQATVGQYEIIGELGQGGMATV